jgi:hypothetical protein
MIKIKDRHAAISGQNLFPSKEAIVANAMVFRSRGDVRASPDKDERPALNSSKTSQESCTVCLAAPVTLFGSAMLQSGIRKCPHHFSQ